MLNQSKFVFLDPEEEHIPSFLCILDEVMSEKIWAEVMYWAITFRQVNKNTLHYIQAHSLSSLWIWLEVKNSKMVDQGHERVLDA